jgi:hypothetical protein
MRYRNTESDTNVEDASGVLIVAYNRLYPDDVT